MTAERPPEPACAVLVSGARMERTIVIGDVHGCREELEAVVEECGWRAGERLVLLGDLVAKGI